MKKISLLALPLFCISFSMQAQQNPFDLQIHRQIIHTEKQAYLSGIPDEQLTSINDYDVKYYRCEWKVNPAVNYVKGKITTYFKPTAPGFNAIEFNLSNSLTVDSVKYHNTLLNYTHTADIISADLPSVIGVNTLDSVSVFYQGVPAGSGFGSFVQDEHNGSPIIWTLSEPYGSSDWWACKNTLTDKADSLDVYITTPAGNKAASNGLLVNITNSGPDKVYHWKHRYPITPYLICMATTNYVEFENNVPFQSTNLLIQNFIYPEDSAWAAGNILDLIPVMQLYDTLFGIYPFQNEKYGHAQFNWGGAMEHQTMTFTGGFWYETLAHELAHHWFGDKITCGSWEDIWLNEGFATYLSGIAYEHLMDGVWWMPYKKARINDIVAEPGGSVWCNDTTSGDRIFDGRLSYDKGAMILHTLRWVIGDSTFYAAINNYLNDPALAYGFARTPQLKAHFDASASQDLTWYFNDWFTGEGFPSYQIHWQQSGNTVDFTVSQTQSHPSVSFFELPIPIEFKNQTQDTIIRFDNTSSGQAYSVTIPFTVDSVIFDPELWIISANNTITTSISENELHRQISISPNPAQDKIQITFSKTYADMEVKLLDVTGRTIKEYSANGLKNLEINIDEIPGGFYFVQLNSGEMNFSRKMIKQ